MLTRAVKSAYTGLQADSATPAAECAATNAGGRAPPLEAKTPRHRVEELPELEDVAHEQVNNKEPAKENLEMQAYVNEEQGGLATLCIAQGLLCLVFGSVSPMVSGPCCHAPNVCSASIYS